MQQNYFDDFELFCDYFDILDIKNVNSFTEAMTHSSFCKKKNYERMEFLGDTILNFCVSKMIFEQFKNEDEGFLSKKKSFLCSRRVCREIAYNIGLDKKIIFSKRSNVDIESIIGNVFESLLCCIYYEYVIEKVEQIVDFLFREYLFIENIDEAKMRLQEIVQKKYHALPEYFLMEKSGTENEPIFTVKVCCMDIDANGVGKNKKEAEKNAAYNMLLMLAEGKNKNKQKK